MPEEEEEQEIENLFENIMKDNIPNEAKEIDFQEVQEAQRVTKIWTQESTHQGTPNYITQDWREQEDLKSSIKKGDSYLQRSSHKTISWFVKRNLTGKKGL